MDLTILKKYLARIFLAEEREREREREPLVFSIGQKIAFAFLLILMLMAVMIGITIYGYNIVIRTHEAISEGASKQGAAGNVRFGVAQLIMFANDFVITDKDDYRRMFEAQRARVDDYQKKLRALELSSDERAIVDSICADVDSIYAYADRIFTIPRPRFSSEAAPLMEIMDYKFGHAVNRKTTEIFDIVLRRIEADKIQSALTRDRMLYTLYTVFLLGLLVSLVIVYLSSQRIAKPIRMVAKAADAIAKGHYSQRPAVSTRDEVELLARSFSQMAETIERTHQELESRKRFTENIVATVPSGLLVIGEPDRQPQQVVDKELWESSEGVRSDMPPGKLISVNRSFCELFTVRQQDVVGQPVEAVLCAIGLSQQCRDAVAARKPFRNLECLCSTPGKGEMTLNLTLSGIRVAEEEEEEEEALLVIDDMTERKRAEHQMRILTAATEQTADCVIITDRDGVIQYVNHAFKRETGYTKEEALGKTPRILKSGEHASKFYEDLWKTILRGRVFRATMINRKKTGELFYEAKTITPLTDAKGNITHFVSTAKDITAQRSLEEQLRQAQKMESLGTLAGGIAHDFNNILGIILGHSSLMESLKLDPDELSSSIQAIIRATQRGASLVNQLLTFAKKTEAIFQPVNINGIIAEVNKLIRETFRKTITISTSVQPELPFIIADATQIHQVLVNLYVNARDAMPKGGRLSISTNTVEGGAISTRFPKATARQYVQLEVGDTGIGMDEATRERIFEPFFTTKGIGKGTGLGLSVVFGIIENHNGFIDVQSAPGKGTSFTVYLPIPEHTPEVSQQTRQTFEDKPGGTETILLIEDEKMLRDFLKTVLVSKGYTVLTAEDGLSGIEMYQSHQNEIAVVLLDLGLPVVSGQDVFRSMREINPAAKIILASGFIEPDTKSEMYKAGLKAFIQKPYLPDEVLQKVREVIDTQK